MPTPTALTPAPESAAAAAAPAIDKPALLAKYIQERDKRLRPDGNAQYLQLSGRLAHLLDDPYTPRSERSPKTDHVRFAFIGGGFAGLVTGARLVEAGVRDVRIVEKGGDFGGTWYWNRYPGAQCDTASMVYMPLLTVQGAMPRDADFKQHLCADIDGFSLHAAVRCGADDRQALEQLCRYITRPALANERVQTNAAGQVVLKLKTPWRDGTTHLVMSPLEFMQRLAALVPRPRLHLIRFHGVLAPNAKLRALVVPQEAEAPAQAAPPAECEAGCTHHRPVRLSWAKLLKRVFEIDMEHCPNCGGELKIIAAILEAPVIEKILKHLGLQARAPPRGPARGQALQAA